jgi:hypothetical protein
MRIQLRNNYGGLPPVETLPVLISRERLDALGEGEEKPFECAVAFSVPVRGTGGIYTDRYYQSVLDGIKERNAPLGGSKTGGMGHDDFSNDIYVVGGQVANGKAILRLLIPAFGYETSNEGLIRAVKAGVQQFSIVADPKPNGRGEFVEEAGIPRFDAVDEGAQKQTVYNSADEAQIMELVSRGEIDIDSEGESLITNGKVCRKAALQMQFNGADKALGARVMNAIAKKLKLKNEAEDPPEEKKMADEKIISVDEAIKALSTAVDNNKLTHSDIANKLGFEGKLRKNADIDREKAIADIKKALELGDDASFDEIKAAITTLLKENDEAAEATAEVEANSIAGTPKLANGADNSAYIYAIGKLKNCRTRAERERAQKALNDDVCFVALRKQNAGGMMVSGSGKRYL